MPLQVYTLLAQRDNYLSLDVAFHARRDSTDMRTIAAVTMFFLPGMFTAVSQDLICPRTLSSSKSPHVRYHVSWCPLQISLKPSTHEETDAVFHLILRLPVLHHCRHALAVPLDLLEHDGRLNARRPCLLVLLLS